jgi:hypothetical protein
MGSGVALAVVVRAVEKYTDNLGIGGVITRFAMMSDQEWARAAKVPHPNRLVPTTGDHQQSSVQLRRRHHLRGIGVASEPGSNRLAGCQVRHSRSPVVAAGHSPPAVRSVATPRWLVRRSHPSLGGSWTTPRRAHRRGERRRRLSAAGRLISDSPPRSASAWMAAAPLAASRPNTTRALDIPSSDRSRRNT